MKGWFFYARTSSHRAPIPSTFSLDAHTRHFFDQAEHSSPIDALFKLDIPAFKNMVFVGRIARFCTGALHLVVQEFTGDTVLDIKAPVLMSALAMPFHNSDPEERAQCTREYFLKYLNYPDSNGAQGWRDLVPVLRGATARAGYTRLHFDSATGTGLQFHEDGCNILDLRELENVTNEVWPHIDLGDALFDYEWVEDPFRAFAEMSDEQFHKRAAEMLDNEQSAVAHSVAFRLMDPCERCHHVFGCEEAEVKRAREMLHLALTVEMGVGGTFSEWPEVSWQPFAEEGLVELMVAGKGWVGVEAPETLKTWLNVIGKKTGCRLSAQIGFDCDEEGLHAFARTWANGITVSMEKPSAHEVLEAGIKLRGTMEAESQGRS